MGITITREEALERLQKACDSAGGVGAFAEEAGVSISAVSHQLSGRRPIQGKVASKLKLKSERKTTLAYTSTGE